MKNYIAFLMILLTSGNFVSAASKTHAAASPSPRYSFALACDESRRRLVLFGGFLNGAYFGDTWEWDGEMWQQTSASGPSARAGHRLVFDHARPKVLLYGGFADAGPTTELWEWDGSAWKMIQIRFA
jgi:hypothetical protein